MMTTYYNNIQLAVLLKGLTQSAPISLHSFQLNILHCITSTTGLTERYSFLSFEGKKALSVQLYIKVSTEELRGSE